MNRRGFINNIIMLLTWALVLLAVILIFYFGGLLLPPLVTNVQDAGGIVTDALQSTNNEALQNASAKSFEPAVQTLNNFEWMAYTFVILMFFAFILMCFYVRTYPFLLWIWIIMIIILVIASIFLAVVYQDLRNDSTLGEYYKSWENTDFLLRNLPILITILGIVGGMIMFIIPSRDQAIDQGGGAYGGAYI